jgi:radical SAM family uncharacterized protein/radical SAM-linked protein
LDYMTRLDPSIIEDILSRVQKPGRYIGRELNIIVKQSPRLRMALSYPDLYEVGMSNNGLRILYEIVNSIPEAACERVFAVAEDFERALRENGVPLYTLETYTPISELDLLGFNMSHELLCTNVLQILDLGGIPLRRRERGEGAPIIIAGGEAVSNPFPMSDFIDAFFIGDGEEGIREIAQAVLSAKESGLERDETIERIGAVNGVLIPSRYSMSYDGCDIAEWSGPAVRKRVYRGRDMMDPVKPLVPNIRIAQERIVIEMTRGCSNFCNFCHAGFYDLPYRCYDYRAAADRIVDIARNTGYNEVTLSSLSISDYPHLASLVNTVLPALTEMGISVSFPSLRVDTATLPIIEQISELRRASLTLAVESASEQIRARANKKLFDRDLIQIVQHVFARGWKVIKLYFMLGLPGCEEYDEAADIIDLLKKIYQIGGRGMDINVTVSPFVPKPHTPFQMERQMGRDYFLHMLRRIKQGLPRSVKIKNHDVEASILEAVIARGDARLGEVIERSYRAGCRFDSWEEHFRCDIWRKNLDDILPGWERCLGRRSGGPMPWHVIETGFERLIEKRINESAAGALPQERKVHPIEPIEAARIEEAKLRFARRFKVTNRIRLRFSKTGMMRFIPHIDFMEIVKRALRMAGAPVAMSQGFNKRERMSAGFPTPLGIESESELVDVELFDDIIESFPDALDACLPDEIGVAGVRAVDEQTSLMAATNVIEYRITTASEPMGLLIRNGLASRPEFIKHSKKNERSITFDQALHSFEFQNDGSLVLRLHAGSEDSVRIDDALQIITGIEGGNMKGIQIVKIAQYHIIDNTLALIY